VKPSRRFLHLAAGAIALPFTARLTSAQAYPNRSVRIVRGAASRRIGVCGPRPCCDLARSSCLN
jgi:hypothetical protein